MSIIRFIITMALLCGAAAGFLAFVNSKTSKIIEANKQKEALKAVMDRVIKGQFTDVSISSNPDSICVYKKVKDRETGVEKTVRFIDAKNGQGRTVVQVVENVSTIGYGGPISILVGIDSTGRIIGSTVLSHTETPGLGDQLLDDWFLKQFIGRTADSGDIKITKFGGNIESISGASISSHAFTSALNEAVILAKERIPCVVPDSSILDSLKVTK